MSPRPLSDDPLDVPRPLRKAKKPQRASGPVRPLLWVYVWGLRLSAVVVAVLAVVAGVALAVLAPDGPFAARLFVAAVSLPMAVIPALPFLVAAELLDVLLNAERLLQEIRDNGGPRR